MSHFFNKKSYKKLRFLFFFITILSIFTIFFTTNTFFLKEALRFFKSNSYHKSYNNNDNPNEINSLVVNINFKLNSTSNINQNVINDNKPIENQNQNTTTPININTTTVILSSNSINLTTTIASTIIETTLTIAYNSTNSIMANNNSNSNNSIEHCALIPPNLGSRIEIKIENHTLDEIENMFKQVQPDLKVGGQWSPKSCKARYKVAIIVPYRDRDYNLQLFLQHMHPFLSKQQLNYGIYLIEPVGNITFNRGLLMNIGFVESNYDTNTNWDCFVFHDVDLLPEDERNIYSCPESPRHMSSAVSTLNYKLPYDKIFGGVTEFTKSQFEKINGFSNLFFGWGGEDDDLRERVDKKGFTVSRYPLDIGRYTMAKHDRDKHNKPNPDRYKLLKTSDKRIDSDGVNSLKYEVKSITKNSLFTKITVFYDQAEILKSAS